VLPAYIVTEDLMSTTGLAIRHLASSSWDCRARWLTSMSPSSLAHPCEGANYAHYQVLVDVNQRACPRALMQQRGSEIIDRPSQRSRE